MCEVILANHALPWRDYAGKCGAKHVALAAKPDQFVSEVDKTYNK